MLLIGIPHLRLLPILCGMTVKNATNAIVPITPNTGFSDAVKELCFEIWLFLADRNAQETVRILEKRLDDFALPPLPDLDRIPSVRTVQNWVKNENWGQKANDKIRDTAEYIDESQIARLFVLSDEAINVAFRIIRGDFLDHPRPGNVAVMADMVKEMLRFRGLGTAGVVGAPTFEVKISSDTAAIGELSVDERSALMREAILRRKEQKRLTGHSS